MLYLIDCGTNPATKRLVIESGDSVPAVTDGYSRLELSVLGDTDVDGTVIPEGSMVTNIYNSAGTKTATIGHSVVKRIQITLQPQFHTHTVTGGTGVADNVDETDTYNIGTLAAGQVTSDMTVIDATVWTSAKTAADMVSDDNIYAKVYVNDLPGSESRQASKSVNDANWAGDSTIVTIAPDSSGNFTLRHRHTYSETGANGSGFTQTVAILQSVLVRQYV